MKTRVIVCADYPLTVQGLKTFLSGSLFDVAATCSDGRECLHAIDSVKPDCLLIDVSVADPSGFSILEMIKSKRLSIRVILLGSQFSDVDLMRASQLGADGLLPMRAEKEEFLQCLTSVTAGHRWIAPALLARLEGLLSRGKITSRENDVVELAKKGLNNKQIARQLRLSEGTIKLHLHNIYRKLNVSGRTELIFSLIKGSAKDLRK